MVFVVQSLEGAHLDLLLHVSASRYQCPDNAYIVSTCATVSDERAARMKRNRTRGLVGKKGRLHRLEALENVSRNTVSVRAFLFFSLFFAFRTTAGGSVLTS